MRCFCADKLCTYMESQALRRSRRRLFFCFFLFFSVSFQSPSSNSLCAFFFHYYLPAVTIHWHSVSLPCFAKTDPIYIFGYLFLTAHTKKMKCCWPLTAARTFSAHSLCEHSKWFQLIEIANEPLSCSRCPYSPVGSVIYMFALCMWERTWAEKTEITVLLNDTSNVWYLFLCSTTLEIASFPSFCGKISFQFLQRKNIFHDTYDISNGEKSTFLI